MQNKDNEKIKLEHKKPFDLRIVGILLVVFMGIIFAFHNKATTIDCTQQYRQDSLIQTPSSKEIAVEIANSPASQSKGLSGRVCINNEWGMLFSFNQEAYRYFWMKDMNFPIDIVWLDSNKRVVDLTENLQPNTYPETFTSILPAQYVLELPANTAQQLGFTPLSQVSF